MDRATRFKKAIVRYIKSFGKSIVIKEETVVGYRFVNTPRKVDIVLYRGGKFLGIEAKLQEGAGTAYQKLSYTLEDCLKAPIPIIIVFAGNGIKEEKIKNIKKLWLFNILGAYLCEDLRLYFQLFWCYYL